MRAVLLTLFVAIHDLTIAILPVVPSTANAVLDQLGIPQAERDYGALEATDWFSARVSSGTRIAAPVAAFPRLDLPVEAAEPV